MTTTARQAALEHIRRGWAPIPVPGGQKAPILTGWNNLRLREDDVPAFFPDGSNNGILTGEASGGLIDADLDSDEAVVLADSFLPPTQMRSGRKRRPGSHRWYRVTDRVPPLVRVKDIDNVTVLLELRGDGHQTLVAPSTHPDDDTYEWEGPWEPTEVSCNEIMVAFRQLAAATLIARHWPRKNGSRHEIANALAGMLLRTEWSSEVTAHFVESVAMAAGDEESRKRAADAVATARKLKSGGRVTGTPTLASFLGAAVVDRARAWLSLTSEAESGQWLPWQPIARFNTPSIPAFPIDVFPAWLREFASAEARATQTPLALVGSLLLASCAVGLGGRVRIEIRAGWSEPLNIYIVVVLDPGNRKSAVFAHATAPILEFERMELRRLAPAINEALARRRVLMHRVNELERRAGKASPERRADAEAAAVAAAQELSQFPAPVAPRLFTDDVTVEKLGTLLHEQGGKFAVLSAEGGIFEILAGRYSKGSQPNFDVLLKAHAGDLLVVDRVGRSPEHVEQPALTVGLTVQRDILRGLADKPGFRGRGLIARFLYAFPASLVGHRSTKAPPVPSAVKNAYRAKLLRLMVAGEEAGGLTLGLTPQAAELLRKFEEELEPQLGRDGDLFGMADWGSKLVGAMGRLAGILHAAECIGVGKSLASAVNEETVANAITLGRFYLAHARAAFAEMAADAEVENARHVLRWIRRSGASEFTERDVHQGTKGRFKKVADVRPALVLLQSHGYVRERLRLVRSGPGRPASPLFDVHPDFGQGNSEDIEDSEHTNPETNWDSSSPPDTEPDPVRDSAPHSQNSPYPQNSSPDEEVAL